MTIISTTRTATADEIAREMDRRGEVIKRLEAELADMSDEQQAEFEARTKAQSELRRAAAEITRLRAENAGMLEALKPFAAVAEHDIGDDEADGDFFRPMTHHNRAPRLVVGDLRRARPIGLPVGSADHG